MTKQEFNDRFISQMPTLYRVAYTLTGNRDEAADLVQDTMISLWNSVDSLNDVSNPAGYCIIALKRKFCDHVRSFRPMEGLIDHSEEQCFENDRIEHRSSLELVRKIIETLPDGQKSVVKLSIYGELSNEEIADLTGYSNENVRTMLSRARRKIRKLYSLNT